MRLRAFARLRDDQRGAAVIELALSAPFLAALIIGMSDMACAYSMKLICEQAAQRTIEQVQQQKSVGTSYNTALSTEAASAMTAAGYSTGNTITPDSWVECSSNGTTWTRQTNFTDACAAGEMTTRYVKVTISRNYSPLFTSWGWANAVDGVIPLSGYAEVRVQ
jgi:Flp pilus assembly protein TadG